MGVTSSSASCGHFALLTCDTRARTRAHARADTRTDRAPATAPRSALLPRAAPRQVKGLNLTATAYIARFIVKAGTVGSRVGVCVIL